jgi:hypothetical protein
LPKGQLTAEAHARARFNSPENIKQRERRENRFSEAVIKTFGVKRNADNEPREQALDDLQRLVALEDMDRHILIFRSIKRVRFLFWNTLNTEFWFVERDMLSGEFQRSIPYYSREHAMAYHEVGTVQFI